MGAMPVQEAYRLRSANRATSPVSARVRAATTGPAPCLPGDVARLDGGEDLLGLAGGDVPLGLSRYEFRQEPVQPVDELDPGPAQLGAAVDQQPQRLGCAS